MKDSTPTGLTPTGLKASDYPWPYSIMGEYVDEGYLTEQIDELWTARQTYTGAIKGEKAQMRSIDTTLAEMLFTMKAVLSRPGRNGGWSAWLKERKIARITADRLVQKYTATLPAEDKLPHDAIQEPTEKEVQKLFTSVWRRSSKVLTTDIAVYQFLIHILVASGIGYEWQDNGVLVLQPGSLAPDATPETAAPTAAAVIAGSADAIIDGDVL